MGVMPAADLHLDLLGSGDICGDSPMDRVRNALARHQGGQVHHVIAYTYEQVFTITRWAARYGHRVLTVESADLRTHIYLEKGAPSPS
ncbi:MAG: hypothetical protein NZ742_09770 [Acidobacteria bacterium]|nr:hypothetical protein [Acidobacteriota bacterium]MDW7984205.1 hypothetical protein [Acidobacteriota bacterium]